MRNRLALKILGSLVVAALAVTAVAYVYFLTEERRIVHDEVERGSQLVVESITKGVQAAMLSKKKPMAKELLKDLIKVDQIQRVAIYSREGDTFYACNSHGPTVRAATTKMVRHIIKIGSRTTRFQLHNNVEFYRALSPIRGIPACYKCHEKKEHVIGVAEVVLATSQIRDRATANRQRLLGAGFSIVGFSMLGLGLGLAVTVIRPIRKLSGVAQEITDGDLTSRATVRTHDELGNLAVAFNTMTDRLQNHIADLETTKVELRQTIERLGQAVSSAHQLDDLMEVVATEAGTISRFEAGVMFLFSDDDELIAEGACGLAPKELAAYNEYPLTRTSPVVARESTNRGTVVEFDPDVDRERARFAILQGATTQLAIPVSHEGRLLGFIGLACRGPCDLSEDWRGMLNALASQTGIAVQQIRLNEQNKAMAVTDGLTGLCNYRRFHERLVSELERAARFGHALSLIMIDVDHFKEFNDQYGHLAGDQVLQELGALLTRHTRRVDCAARYGGEEFAVVLLEMERADAAENAERLRTAAEEYFATKADDGFSPVTISLGVATSPGDGVDADELIGAADKALYAAKDGGRNAVAVAGG